MRQRPRPDHCAACAVARLPACWTRIPPVGFIRPCEPKLGERAKVWCRRGADFTIGS